MIESAERAASTQTGRSAPAPTQRQQWQHLAPALADVVLPLAGFYLLRLAGMSFPSAYAGAAAIGALCLITVAALQRRFDGIAAFMLAEFCVHAVVALATQDARLTLAAQSVTTGVAGIAMLISRAAGHPAFHVIALKFAGTTPERRAAIEHRWATLPGYRQLMATMTVVGGFVLLTEALLRIVLLMVVSPDALVGISRIMQIVVVGGLVIWTRWYAKRTAPQWN